MIKMYKRLGWYFKAHWLTYLFMGVLLIILSVLTPLPAKYLGEAIDAISSNTITPTQLTRLAILIIGIPFLHYLLNIIYHYTLHRSGQRLSFKLRQKYLNHLFELDTIAYEQYSKGDLVARVTSDLTPITSAATLILQNLIYNLVLLISTITLMFMINVKLSLATVILMPIALFAIDQVRQKMRKYYRTHRKIYSNFTNKVLESVEGIKTVRAYGQEKMDEKNLLTNINADLDSWWKILKFESIFTPIFDFVNAICYFIAFAFGTYLVINQEISLGDLITFAMYTALLAAPSISLSSVFTSINSSVIASDRFQEIMDLQPQVKDVSTPINIINFQEIHFENVSFKYHFDKNATIKNITFTIKKGETIGIVGPTGAGKSTLIRQLLREFNVMDGKITIDNQPIENFAIVDVRNLVGYVPQSHILFKRSVDENLLIGNPHASIEDIERAIQVADFKKDLVFLKDGLKTEVGEFGSTLSGGQKQRLTIARAIVKDPEILILDDSLSAVDAKTEQNIIAHVKESRLNKTNIIVAHRFSAVKHANIILVLEGGKITQHGTHDELLAMDGWYKKQYIRQTSLDKEAGYETI